MTKDEFKKNIIDEISVSGSLGIELNEKEIDRIIEIEKRYVYLNWRNTVESRFTVISPIAFRTEEFRTSRSIQMPDCVWGIQEFREIRDGGRLFGINDPDLGTNRIFGSDIFLSPFSTDVIASRTMSYSAFDLMRSFTLDHIQFTFNPNSHKIVVNGHDPIAPVLVRCFVGIDDGALYDDPMFYKHVLGKCYIQVHRILKTFESNLLGGINIASYFMDLGKEYINEVKEYQDKISPPDWFFMFQ
jgi:hypothetical protein